MKRVAVIVVVVLLSGFMAVSVWKRTRDAAESGTESQPELSEERKAEIRSFWKAYRRATELRGKGEWERAADEYRRALAVDDEHEDALYYLGNVLFELNEYEEAVTTWRRLTEVNPMSTRAYIQLGSVYSCGADGAPLDLEVADKEFRRALAINKEETGPILKLGEVSLLKGHHEQALTYFTTAIQSNHKSVQAHYLIGYVKWVAGEREAALNALRQAAKHSRTKRPTGQPLGEGDTRTPGTGPILAEGASRRSFFASSWETLKTWEDKEISARQMEGEYEELQGRLRFLAEKGRAR